MARMVMSERQKQQVVRYPAATNAPRSTKTLPQKSLSAMMKRTGGETGCAACVWKAKLNQGRRATGPHSFPSTDFVVANVRRGDPRRKNKDKKVGSKAVRRIFSYRIPSADR